MPDVRALDKLLKRASAQAKAFEKRERSRAGQIYNLVMDKSTAILKEYSRSGSFDQLLRAEKIFQDYDLKAYAKVVSTIQAVQKGMRDFDAGEEVYRQLLNDPEAYKAHRYREDDHAAPDKVVPLDAMRKALRGQVSRVGNYRKNVMSNSQEYDFLTARIAMIRRAEKLYDGIQRDRLLPSQ